MGGRCLSATALIAALSTAMAGSRSLGEPIRPPPAEHVQSDTRRAISFFAGTWCFSDGARSHYAVIGPGRLRLTRLSFERRARFGPTLEFPVEMIDGNRSRWGFDGRRDYFVVVIDGDDSFRFTDFLAWNPATQTHDRETNRPEERARRCAGEIASRP